MCNLSTYETLVIITYNHRLSINRPHEDVIESHKRRQHILPGQKRHWEESYDSRLSLKKPNLDIEEPLQTSSQRPSKSGMYNIYVTII